jgi:hypothetical protein
VRYTLPAPLECCLSGELSSFVALGGSGEWGRRRCIAAWGVW